MYQEKQKLGYYPIGNRKLYSVTSIKEFTLGIPPGLNSYIVKQTLLAVARKEKELKKRLTQKEKLEYGKIARRAILDESRDRGTQVHKAIDNHHKGFSYELPEDYVGYFEAYDNWSKDKTIEPILTEYKVWDLDYGYAGRFDFYGIVNGKRVLIDYKTSSVVDWDFGLQLVAYKNCLEKLNHHVDEMWVLQLKPKQRGGSPYAEVFKFDYSFDAWKHVLGLFHTKLSRYAPSDIDFYERTDEGAVEAELKKDADVKSTPVFVPSSDAPGRQSDTPDTSPSRVATRTVTPELKPQVAYPYQAETPIPWQSEIEVLLAEEQPTTRSSSQPENRADETSERRTETPPGRQIVAEGETVRFVDSRHRILPGTSRRLSARDTLPEEIELDPERIEQGSLQAGRLKTA